MTIMATDTDAIAHLASKVQDHSSVLQAMQVDIQHIVRAIEKLAVVGEKQAELASEMRRHSDSIERAFRQMDSHKSDLTTSIDGLAEALREDRRQAQGTAESVVEFKSALRTVKWLGGLLVSMLALVATMYSQGNEKDKARLESSVSSLQADFDRRKLSVDLKVDALSQQVQEVRLDRQRDRETEDKQP